MEKYTTDQIEYEVAQYFNPRVNLIVPNVSWGMFFNHECDLVVVTPFGCCYEVELKNSASDLRKDQQKPHKHLSKKIKGLYFGIPWYLCDDIEAIPEHAGIIVVGANFNCVGNTKRVRMPKPVNDYRFTSKDFMCLYRLASMRTWTLKQKLLGI